MSKKKEVTECLLQQKLLPLFYEDSAELSIAILRALYGAGIRIVEYTARGRNAISNFAKLRNLADAEMPKMFLGIGTIKTVNQAKEYLEAGADFVVCPIVSRPLAEILEREGIFWIPGCMTPTEISLAEEVRAEIIKIFPCTVLPPAYILSLKELFPGLKFIPTGGIKADEKSLFEWFGSGVVAVGLGTGLITKEVIQKREFDKLRISAEQTLRLVRSINEIIARENDNSKINDAKYI